MKTVPVNESGLRIGEGHPRAKLSDADVDRIRTLHEDYRLSYDDLAGLWRCARTTIATICQYETRAQTPAGFKAVR